jgi:glycosyltransferase involved in cell wall biosynthesis
MLSVAIVHTDFRLYWLPRLKALKTYLENKGISLSIIEISGKGSPYSFSGNSPKADSGWHCLYPDMPMEDIPALDAVSKVNEILDSIRPDVVMGGAIAFPSGAAVIKWASKYNKHVIIFDDARLSDIKRPYYVDWIKRQIYTLVDAMLIPAPSHNDTYNYFGIPNDRIFHGVNAIDNKFFIKKSTTDSFHEDIVLPDAHFFLAVGRQIKIKNWKLLLKVFIKLSDSDQLDNWQLVFVGNGPDHDELIEMAGISSKKSVHFLPFLSQNQLRACYHRASAMILPSHSETWGLVVNEAMAAGLPVLVSNRCGCAETLVDHGGNGYTFNPDDEHDIEKVILDFVRLGETEHVEMSCKSLSIIEKWGIVRFCEGVKQSIDYCTHNDKRKGTFWGRRIIKYWNGQYNPV